MSIDVAWGPGSILTQRVDLLRRLVDKPRAHDAIGLTHALHQMMWGFWFDMNEDFLLEERCIEVIERTVGRPDAFWTGPENYTNFARSGSDVSDGLIAFDEWLIDDQAAHDTRDGVTVRTPPRRLVEINTGSDYALAMLCRENHVKDAMVRLADVGIRSRLQTADERWPLGGAFPIDEASDESAESVTEPQRLAVSDTFAFSRPGSPDLRGL